MSDDPKDLSGDQKIVAEAKKRFDRCKKWESDARERFKEDIKFVNGDADNGYQWPNGVLQVRQGDNAPSLTINKTRQHCLQIINDAKQNKPGVNIRPVGGDATFEAAQVFEGIVRHIEYLSGAEQIYDTATTFQVHGGIGYWRVVTDYVDDQTLDQDIFLRRIKDPLSVYLDPDINEIDGSDARFCFIFDDVPKDKFEAEYPNFKDEYKDVSFGDDDWKSDDHVRVAEYYRRDGKADTFAVVTEPKSGQQLELKKSEVPKEIWAQFEQLPDFKSRPIINDEITWYKIAGDKIIDRRKWPGQYIPVVRIIGEEAVIDGKLDRKGHVRSLKDPQRMYNYWSSAAVEQVALQSKMPYVAPVKAIEGLEDYWKNANRENRAVLPYNSVDEEGNQIPAPERQQPPQMAVAYIKGMEIAQNEMMMASGQYQAQMGENENAKSGKAIAERQRQGDNATYHFIDGLAIGIRYTGKILIDLIPKVYDTERVIKILAEDGQQSDVQVDPQAPQSFQEITPPQQPQQDPNEIKAQIIFNPNVGRYSVQADIGPAYATKRQEAFNAFSQIISQNENLVQIAGDLLFKNADFPGADEIAQRLRRMVPPQATGDGPPPELQHAMMQNQALQHALAELSKKLSEAEMANQNKDVENRIKAFDADTKRITAVANAQPEMGEKEVKGLFDKTVGEAMDLDLDGVMKLAAKQLQTESNSAE